MTPIQSEGIIGLAPEYQRRNFKTGYRQKKYRKKLEEFKQKLGGVSFNA